MNGVRTHNVGGDRTLWENIYIYKKEYSKKIQINLIPKCTLIMIRWFFRSEIQVDSGGPLE